MILVSIGQERLVSSGSVIKIKIGSKYEKKLIVEGWALLDTGGQSTHIEENLLRQLKLSPINHPGALTFNSTTGSQNPVQRDLYEVYIQNNELNIKILLGGVTCSDMKFQKFNGESVIAILGRDFLQFFEFVYNGKDGIFSLIPKE